MKRTIVSLVSILCLLVAGNCFAFFGDSKFEQEVKKEAGAIKLLNEVQRGDYKVVSTAELNKWIADGEEMVIVDTMPYEASYKKAHVPGAEQFLFPIPDMTKWDSKETANKSEDDYEAVLGKDKNKKIIVYCGFVKCTRSHNGAVWAKNLGYTNVYRFPGGIYAWKGAGFDVEVVE
ncbi:MAG: rhodanese-like domain-containing protein [Desulfotalea sp.]